MRAFQRRGRPGPVAPVLVAVTLVAVALAGARAVAAADDDEAAARGAYLAAAAGCVICHTDLKAKGPRYAGGGPMATPFGTFYAPNITSDRTHGIGAWSERDFVRALGEGIAPDGAHYFPTFPYPSYSRMTGAEMRALWAYFRTVAAVARPDRRHLLRFPYSWRFLQTFWKLLNFRPGPDAALGPNAAPADRGRHLVRALAHCGECHTPRDSLGGLRLEMWLAGTADGPDGAAVPNITPDRETGIGGWSDDEIATYLESGMDPDGDFAGSLMADIVDHATGRLNAADIGAIVSYLRTLAPVRNRVQRRPGGP